jgi:hypothetical protein
VSASAERRTPRPPGDPALAHPASSPTPASAMLPRCHAPSSFVSRHCAAARRRRRPPAWRPREVDAGRARTGPRRSSRGALGSGVPRRVAPRSPRAFWMARWLSARSSMMTGTVAPTRPWTRPAADVEQTMTSTRRTSRPSARPAAAQVSTRAMFGNAAAVIECSSVWLVSTAAATTPTFGGQGFLVSRIGRSGDRATNHLVVVSGRPITCSRRLARASCGVGQVAVLRSSTLCQVLAQRRTNRRL